MNTHRVAQSCHCIPQSVGGILTTCTVAIQLIGQVVVVVVAVIGEIVVVRGASIGFRAQI